MRYFAADGRYTGYKAHGVFFESRAENARGLMRAATAALGREPWRVLKTRREGMFTFVDGYRPVEFDWELDCHY